MSLTRLHNLYAASIFPDSLGGAVVLDGVIRQSVEHGYEVRGTAVSGSPYVRFVSIVNGAPMARFGTYKMAAALDTIGPTGLAITSVTNDGLKLFAYAHADGGTRKSGSTHRQYLIKKGLIVPKSITCEGQGDAELDFDTYITSDGTNSPIIESDAVAVPALTGDDERFAIGPITLESVTFPQVKRVEIDFGLAVQARAIDGDVFPTFVSIDTIAPKITLRGIDVEWLKSSNLPRTGLPITHANTSIFLRKRLIDGTFYGDGESEHLQVTANGLAVIQQIFDAEQDAEGECSIEITTRHDGTNSPLVFDTAAAIS